MLTPSSRITQQTLDDHEYSQAVWESSERLLYDAVGDILGIFDCCNAGHLSQTRAPLRFEYLGACPSDQVTKSPGPNSFTSALIWAFQQLKSSGPFSTSALQAQIKLAPDFPTNQIPTLGPRCLGATTEYIMMAPHGPNDEQINTQKPSVVCDFFDLRIYVTEMDKDVITAWAKAMTRHVSNKKLKVSRYAFRGANVDRCITKWRFRARGNTRTRPDQQANASDGSIYSLNKDKPGVVGHLDMSAFRDPLTPDSSRCQSQNVSVLADNDADEALKEEQVCSHDSTEGHEIQRGPEPTLEMQFTPSFSTRGRIRRLNAMASPCAVHWIAILCAISCGCMAAFMNGKFDNR